MAARRGSQGRREPLPERLSAPKGSLDGPEHRHTIRGAEEVVHGCRNAGRRESEWVVSLRRNTQAVLRLPALTEAQDGIRDISARLQEVGGRKAACEALRDFAGARGEFEPLSELRGVLKCVRSDLVGDAIATLEAGAGPDVLAPLVDYLKRQLRRC